MAIAYRCLRGGRLAPMRYLVVMLFSLAVGAVVYVLSLRAEESEVVAIGFEPTPPHEGPPEATVEGPPPGYTYLQVAVTRGPSLRERVQGLVGSIVLVVVAAIVMAATVYAAGSLIGRVIEAFFEQEPSVPAP